MTFVERQTALATGVGIAKLPWQVVKISGQERLSWLTTLSSQIFLGANNFYLSPRGSGQEVEIDADTSVSAVTDGNSADEGAATSTSPADGSKTTGNNMASGGKGTFSLTPQKGGACLPLQREQWLSAPSVTAGNSYPTGVEGLLLDPQGRIQFPLRLLDYQGVSYLLIETELAAGLVEFLKRMRFFTPVEIEYQPDVYQIWGWQGRSPMAPTVAQPESVAELLDLELPIWIDPWPGVAPGGTSYYGEHPEGTIWDRDHPGGSYGACLLVLHSDRADQAIKTLLSAWAEQINWPLISDQGDTCQAPRVVEWTDWEALRIAAARPSAADLDDKTLPHELNWVRTAVHLHKGCYCGQETVARIINLGRPPRLLCRVDLDGSTNQLPTAGSPLKIGKRQVGRILAAANHYQDGPVAWALISRRVPLTEVFQVEVSEMVVQGDSEGGNAAQTVPSSENSSLIPAYLTALVNLDGKCWDSPAEKPGLQLRGPSRNEQNIHS